MSALTALANLIRIVTMALALFKDERLKQEGEKRLELEMLKDAERQRMIAHEINHKVNTSGLSDSELEWMRKFERKDV